MSMARNNFGRDVHEEGDIPLDVALVRLASWLVSVLAW
jgi:hypothetical protein